MLQIMNMDVKALHEALGQLIEKGKGDYTVWNPACKRPGVVSVIMIDEDDHNIVLT